MHQVSVCVWHLFQAFVVICLCTNVSLTCIFGHFRKLQSHIIYVCEPLVMRKRKHKCLCVWACVSAFVFVVRWLEVRAIMKTKSKNCMHIWCRSMPMPSAPFQFRCCNFRLNAVFFPPRIESFANGTVGVVLWNNYQCKCIRLYCIIYVE